MRLRALALLAALVGCQEGRGIEGAPTPPVAGSWRCEAGNLELRASDSVIVADPGVLPLDEKSIWIADDRNVYQILEFNYVRLRLARATDPIRYAGSAWPVALIGAASQAYKYTFGQNSLCLKTASFERCFQR